MCIFAERNSQSFNHQRKHGSEKVVVMSSTDPGAVYLCTVRHTISEQQLTADQEQYVIGLPLSTRWVLMQSAHLARLSKQSVTAMRRYETPERGAAQVAAVRVLVPEAFQPGSPAWQVSLQAHAITRTNLLTCLRINMEQ